MDAAVGILGAGASGLSLALLLDQKFVIVERDRDAGGHARSTTKDGFTFDRGPHIMFSRDPMLLDCMVSSLGDNVHMCRRNNKVSIAGGLARYPIENDLAALPLPLRADAVLSLLHAAGDRADPTNLAEWFEAHFGAVLTAAYFRPYNEKVWNVPLEQLSMAWSDRIPKPPVDDDIRGALGELSEGYTHQLFYSYPLRGGYSAIVDSWAAGVDSGNLALGQTVGRIEPTGDGVKVIATDGQWHFESVVSTLPLGQLVDMVPGVPESVRRAVDRLIVNPMIVVTLGFAGEDPDAYTAVYVPDADYLVNRVSWPSVFSPHNAPPGHFSVQAEITTERDSEVVEWSDDKVVGHVLEGLRERALLPDDVEHVFTCVERFEHAYVVYSNGYESDLELARAWFEDQGIVLHGRFGSHQYANVDGCLRQSIDLARRLGTHISDEEIRTRFAALGKEAS